MSAFDLTLRIIGADVNTVSEANEDPEGLQLSFVVGALLPIAGPDGQPIVIPLGTLRLPINKQAASALGREIVEQAEKIVEHPHIDIASSLAGVDAAAKMADQIRGK